MKTLGFVSFIPPPLELAARARTVLARADVPLHARNLKPPPLHVVWTCGAGMGMPVVAPTPEIPSGHRRPGSCRPEC